MRKVTQLAISAFYNRTNYTNSNTSVRHDATTNTTTLYLHGNAIARLSTNTNGTTLHITSAGWTSNTTKERLNALKGVSIQQRAFQWYLNGSTTPWTNSDQWTLVTN